MRDLPYRPWTTRFKAVEKRLGRTRLSAGVGAFRPKINEFLHILNVSGK